MELEVTADQAAVALAALEPLGARRDPGRSRLMLPAPDGPVTLRRAQHLLDNAAVTPTDAAVHRPTLDDVFFTLTREPA